MKTGSGFLVFLGLLASGQVKGEDVVGCGGFVRSRFPVDFTRIQVCVYTACTGLFSSRLI